MWLEFCKIFSFAKIKFYLLSLPHSGKLPFTFLIYCDDDPNKYLEQKKKITEKFKM